jgi:hypothetical protein
MRLERKLGTEQLASGMRPEQELGMEQLGRWDATDRHIERDSEYGVGTHGQNMKSERSSLANEILLEITRSWNGTGWQLERELNSERTQLEKSRGK